MTKCKYGDPTCPCRDGDVCHYEGESPMNVPPEYVRHALAEARETERKRCAGIAQAEEQRFRDMEYIAENIRDARTSTAHAIAAAIMEE